MVSNELTLNPLEGGVQPGEMGCKHAVSMPEEVSISQRHSGSRYGQERLVIVSLQGQGDAKPVDRRSTINFQTSVRNGAAKTGPGLCRCGVPIEEYPDKRRGKVECLADV